MWIPKKNIGTNYFISRENKIMEQLFTYCMYGIDLTCILK